MICIYKTMEQNTAVSKRELLSIKKRAYYQANKETLKAKARAKYNETKDTRIKKLYCPELDIIIVYE